MAKTVKLLSQQSREKAEVEGEGGRFVAQLRVFKGVAGYSGVSSWAGCCFWKTFSCFYIVGDTFSVSCRLRR